MTKTFSTYSKEATSEIEELFKKELNKSAVQPINKTVIDQINNIINKKSKFPSVNAIVEDMQQRSGYAEYLKNKKNANQDIQMNTSNDSMNPDLFSVCPQAKDTVQNIVIESHGLLPVPAIIDRLMTIHKKDCRENKFWSDQKLVVYVYNINKNEKSKYIDRSNYDQLGKRPTVEDNDKDNLQAFPILDSKI